MAIRILIPYNFTMNDEKSIDFVITRYARKKDVEITLFHAFSPVPEIDIRNNPIMGKMTSSTSYLLSQQDEQKNALESAKQKLINSGFVGHNIHCLYKSMEKDIANDIIRLWKVGKFDVVVLNRNPGNIINYFSRSISKRITGHGEGGIGVHIVN